ncbi:MAG: glycosyltransferase family 39 protein [Kiritimatiellae bacterium]|nr:glycosyltransferase family 39 protein [Kiritimatiellia bacterium]
MNQQAPCAAPPSAARTSSWIALAVTLVLFVALRLPWLGHLLTWDEAITLCSQRAFASGGTDFYAGWFWRHPPLFSTLLMLLKPLAAGFDVRAELLTILAAAAGCAALFLVNDRVLGRRAALWSAFFIAVMPGAGFYDVWIKQDVFVIVFGLLMLNFFFKGSYIWSGVCLGLALLGKELAVFYAVTLFILWFLQGRGRRRRADLAVIYGVAALVSGWWYLGFSNSLKAIFLFVTDVGHEGAEPWLRPWYYFLERMPLDLGWWGIALALCGTGAMLVRARATGAAEWAWPLALLLPSYAVISLMPAKTPWFTISLFPAFAAIQGLGMDWLLRRIGRGSRRGWCRAAAAAAAALVVGWALGMRAGASYEDMLRKRDARVWRGAQMSRDIARELNRHAEEGQVALITPMFYWGSVGDVPCPVFTYYLEDMPVVVRRRDIPLEAFVEAVRENRVTWAMVSPDPGEGEEALVYPLMRRYGLRPLWTRGALIFRTDALWREES